MFSKDHYINIFSVLIIAFVSCLYFFKYVSIYIGKFPFVITLFYISIFSFVLLELNNIQTEKLKPFTSKKLLIILWILIICAFLYVTFVPRFGNIGRFPAIVDWLNRFFSGKFPYNSPFTPSGYPFLFILTIPFYLIGNVGYLEVTGLALFFFFLFNYSKNEKEIITVLIILMMSPVLYYGIVVRDELFFNMMLAITAIFISEKYLDPERINIKFIFIGILFGLALSTRSVVALIYAVYLPYAFRTNIPKGAFFLVIVFSVFILLLLPFLIWDEKSFMHNGPIAIQSYLSHIPFWSAVLFVLISAALGWAVSDLQEVFFTCGLLLFIPVLLSMMLQIFRVGFYRAIVHDVFDPSYFIFSIPFLLLSIKEYKVDKFLGKVFNQS